MTETPIPPIGPEEGESGLAYMIAMLGYMTHFYQQGNFLLAVEYLVLVNFRPGEVLTKEEKEFFEPLRRGAVLQVTDGIGVLT